MKFLGVILLLLLVLSSCDQPGKATVAEKQSGEVLDFDSKKALSLMSAQCYSCHSPTAPEDSRIAPPMVAVKRHYMEDISTKEGFVNSVVEFVKMPSKEKSKMPGAVRKFNLMPMLGYAEEDVRLIAEFLYHTSVDAPEWFEEHYQKEHGTTQSRKDPVAFGRNVAMTTKSQLGKNLLGAIKEKGTSGALKFCNAKALPLTDSMAQVHQVMISRVSDKPRNPDNQADKNELQHIASFNELSLTEQKMQPITEVIQGRTHFYMPIMTNQMCMQCHGQKQSEIKTAILEKLNALYPSDQATGYAENQVRGIWSISWTNEVD